jgi:hypothetical protein
VFERALAEPTESCWQSYGDSQLDALIREALAGSPNIAVAEARLRRAQAATTDMTFWQVSVPLMLLGLGLPFIFLPITAHALWRLRHLDCDYSVGEQHGRGARGSCRAGRSQR